MRFIEKHLQSPFCIYGAGIVATSVYTAIRTLYHKKPLFFLVSDAGHKEGLDKPPEEIDGISVKRLEEWRQEQITVQRMLADRNQAEQTETTVGRMTDIPAVYIVATPEEHHAVIIETLRTCAPYSFELLKMSDVSNVSDVSNASDVSSVSDLLGVSDASLCNPCIIPVTGAMESELMERYYRVCMGRETVSGLLSKTKMPEPGKTGAPFPIESVSTQVQVFQAKSHMDKPLRGPAQPTSHKPARFSNLLYGDDTGHGYTMPHYIIPIQAGAALTSQAVANLQDNTGDNISAKNRNYCELTVTYHAWKNCSAAYKGICHYRRIFDIDDVQMQALLTVQDKWDVILPYPSVYYPDISKEHMRYVKESDWNAMLSALSETAPEYLEIYREGIRNGERFFHNFNMLIAKAEVFDDYCSFLFRVLQRTEEHAVPKGWERADRFAGYLGENLTTLYFLKNRDKLKIAYAGKIWLT